MKKLIRDKMAFNLNPDELDYCHNKEELMELYSLKLREEIEEIKGSDYKDIMEYGDLIQVALGLASLNGYSFDDVIKAMNDKYELKGGFSNLVLTSLNPNNPSNKIYFENNI
jgi:predicted house-cleaning noncanonical NTP pyrophosphatase (MazG superfamily)